MSDAQQNRCRIQLEKDLDLGADFSPPDFEEWKRTALESLKGAPFEKLETSTYEGINLQPIYTQKDIAGLAHLDQAPGLADNLRGTTPGGYLGHPWEICQETPAALVPGCNEALKYDLQRGQTGINLVLDRAAQQGRDSDGTAGEAGKDGTAVSTLEDLAAALANIDCQQYPLHIQPGLAGLEVMMMLNAMLNQQGKQIEQVSGSIDTDPLGWLSTHGHLPTAIETVYDRLAWVTGWAARHAPQIKTVGVSGLPYHHAGADAVRELAYVMATGVEYIDRLQERGLTLENIAGHMRFTLGIGPYYFMEVAKIRAARILWAKIVSAYGGSSQAQKITIHARTSLYNQTKYDPYVNMLRTTTEAFAAATAGVDSIQTNPFNEVFGTGTEFSRRAARNIQVLLREECHLARLIDPAGGSYYVEKLTHDVCQKAWERFQRIEAQGGMYQALRQGIPQEETAAVHEKRRQDIAKRKSLLVGTNYSANVKEKKLDSCFPDLDAIYRERQQYLQTYRQKRSEKQQSEITKAQETLKALPAAADANSIDTAGLMASGSAAFLNGATLGEVSAALKPVKAESISIKPLAFHRAAEIFEELRDAVEIYKEKTGAGLKLFLATMGPLAQHKARADFSQAFFEVGGFEVVYPQFTGGQGYTTPEAASEAALQSEAPVVVICSTDDTYPQLVPPLTRMLKEKNPNLVVVLAGFPKDQVEMHKQAGVDDFIFLGADAYQILAKILKQLGVLS